MGGNSGAGGLVSDEGAAARRWQRAQAGAAGEDGASPSRGAPQKLRVAAPLQPSAAIPPAHPVFPTLGVAPQVLQGVHELYDIVEGKRASPGDRGGNARLRLPATPPHLCCLRASLPLATVRCSAGPAWAPSERRASKLVFIGRRLRRDKLAADLAACLASPEAQS